MGSSLACRGLVSDDGDRSSVRGVDVEREALSVGLAVATGANPGRPAVTWARTISSAVWVSGARAAAAAHRRHVFDPFSALARGWRAPRWLDRWRNRSHYSIFGTPDTFAISRGLVARSAAPPTAGSSGTGPSQTRQSGPAFLAIVSRNPGDHPGSCRTRHVTGGQAVRKRLGVKINGGRFRRGKAFATAIAVARAVGNTDSDRRGRKAS